MSVHTLFIHVSISFWMHLEFTENIILTCLCLESNAISSKKTERSSCKSGIYDLLWSVSDLRKTKITSTLKAVFFCLTCPCTLFQHNFFKENKKWRSLNIMEWNRTNEWILYWICKIDKGELPLFLGGSIRFW